MASSCPMMTAERGGASPARALDHVSAAVAAHAAKCLSQACICEGTSLLVLMGLRRTRDRLDQLASRKRLAQISHAAGVTRLLARDLIVKGGHENNRKRRPCRGEFAT